MNIVDSSGHTRPLVNRKVEQARLLVLYTKRVPILSWSVAAFLLRDIRDWDAAFYDD